MQFPSVEANLIIEVKEMRDGQLMLLIAIMVLIALGMLVGVTSAFRLFATEYANIFKRDVFMRGNGFLAFKRVYLSFGRKSRVLVWLMVLSMAWNSILMIALVWVTQH